MKPIFTIFLIVALVKISLASGENSEVASTLGYTNKSEKVSAGPYTLHYGESQDGGLYLLANGNCNIISNDGDDTTVYQKGLPWLSYQADVNGTVTNISMTISDAQGEMMKIMIDENADGQWDMKIDVVQKQVFVWSDDKWIQREKNTTANQSVHGTR